jgi:hypothetical protein
MRRAGSAPGRDHAGRPATAQGARRAAEGPFVGDTDSTGRFALGPIGRPGGGVRPGAYRLSISTAFSLDSDAPAPKELVPAAHVNGVDYEVSAGGDSAVTLDLKSTGKPR